jgi:chemotaxis protein MotA
MDLATIGGLILGVVTIMVVMILDGGSPAELFAVPQAILLIVLGSIAATTITVPLSILLKVPKLLQIAMFNQHHDVNGTVELLAKMTERARRDGLLALEEESKKIHDPFIQKAIMLVVDGVDTTQVRAIMENSIAQMQERHKGCYSFFTAAGAFAPTFGIIGTVMGLISVLKQLDDPGKLAESIASAFLATLWGLIMANLIYLPLGGKLKFKDEEEASYRYMIMEGILSMQAGENPRILREKLASFLPPSHEKDEKGDAKGNAQQPVGQKA